MTTPTMSAGFVTIVRLITIDMRFRSNHSKHISNAWYPMSELIGAGPETATLLN